MAILDRERFSRSAGFHPDSPGPHASARQHQMRCRQRASAARHLGPMVTGPYLLPRLGPGSPAPDRPAAIRDPAGRGEPLRWKRRVLKPGGSSIGPG